MPKDLFVDTQQVPGYTPANHTHTVNRRLIDERVGAKTFELLLGTATSDGAAQEHYHPGIDQLCYVLKGTALTSVAGQTCAMEPGQACYFPSGRSHSMKAASGQQIKVLVAYSPPYMERKSVGIAGPDPLSEPGSKKGIVPWPKPLFTQGAPAPTAEASLYPNCKVLHLVDGALMNAKGLNLERAEITGGVRTLIGPVQYERAFFVLQGSMSVSLSGQSSEMKAGMTCFVPQGVAVAVESGITHVSFLVFSAPLSGLVS